MTFRSTGRHSVCGIRGPRHPLACAFSVPAGREGQPSFCGESARGHPAGRVHQETQNVTCVSWKVGGCPVGASPALCVTQSGIRWLKYRGLGVSVGVRLGGSHPLPYILLIRQEVGGKWLDGGGRAARRFAIVSWDGRYSVGTGLWPSFTSPNLLGNFGHVILGHYTFSPLGKIRRHRLTHRVFLRLK